MTPAGVLDLAGGLAAAAIWLAGTGFGFALFGAVTPTRWTFGSAGVFTLATLGLCVLGAVLT